MPRIHVTIKNQSSGEIYHEFDFDQSTGVDIAMGSNVGSLYRSSNQVTHISLELTGELVLPKDEQMELFSGT